MTKMETVINSIRDILRKEGVTGMDSINHCIVFLISRMLNKELCKKLDIDKKFIFKNITKDDKGEELGNQDLYNRIYNGTKGCLIGQIMFKLGFKNIKFKLEGIHNLKLIYDKLKDLNTKSLSTKYDLIGTIYELHLKSGTSNAMRDLGQYYTHRLVIQYMIKLCDPQMKNGMIEKIVDPTMGTGGFLTMSIKYLNKKYKNNIDWQKNKDNIIGFDIDDNVKNMALLNIFLEISELCSDTLIKQDTLHNDMKFTNDGTVLEKADIILANEPMGLKNIVHATLCDRIKNMKIRGTKAEPLFLQLFMEALNDNGRCAVIIPDGVLFNKSNLHNGTRKHLIENFNLQKVVSLNDDFFLNTGVKTSILFFSKDGNKTKKVDFCEIQLKNGEIEENSIIKVKYSKIKEANYSLFVNKYNASEIEKIEGIEYKKLGEICDFLPTTKHTSSIGKENGLYRFYNSSQTNKLYLDTYEVNKESIIIGNGGNLCIHYDKTFTPSKHVTVCQQNKISKINMKYLYYFLVINSKLLKQKSAGSTIQWLNKTNIASIEIPIPSLIIQEAIVKRLDVLNGNIEKSKQMVDEYHKIIKYYVDCQTKNEKEYKLDTICNINPENISGTYDFINYIDISSVNNGQLAEINELTKCYPSRAKRLINKHDILLSTVRPNLKNYLFIDKNIENGVCSTGFCVIRSKNKDKYLPKMLYYQIQSEKVTEYLVINATGSQYPAVNSTIVGNIKIKIPYKEKQKEIVEYCDNLSNAINIIEQQIKDNKDLMKQIMDSYLNQKEKKKEEIEQSDNDNIEMNIDTEESKSSNKSKKDKKDNKKSAKTKKADK